MGEGNNLPSPVGGRAAEHGCEGVKAPLKGSVISVAPTLAPLQTAPAGDQCPRGADPCASLTAPGRPVSRRRPPCASPTAPVGQGELRGVDPSPCRILPVLWGLVHDEERSPPQNLFSVQRTSCFVPTEAYWSSSPSPLASACPWRSFKKSGRASPMRGVKTRASHSNEAHSLQRNRLPRAPSPARQGAPEARRRGSFLAAHKD